MTHRHEFFNRMAATWDEGETEKEESLRRVAGESNLAPGQRVLDVGTGTGILLPHIAEKIGGKGEIYAIDYAEEMIGKLKENAPPACVEAHVMDIHETDFPDAYFDRIIANSCYPHFENKSAALNEIHRLLKPGGLFILSHPSGRRHVNEIHSNAGAAVQKDILPAAVEIAAFITSKEFCEKKIIDEELFFMAVFGK